MTKRSLFSAILLLIVAVGSVRASPHKGHQTRSAPRAAKIIHSRFVPHTMALSSDGKTLVVSKNITEYNNPKSSIATKCYSEVDFFDVPSGHCKRKLLIHSQIGDIAFAPNGKTLVISGLTCVDGNPFDPGELRILDAHTGKQLRFIQMPGRLYAGLAFSPRGDYLALGGQTHKVQQCVLIYDTSTWKIKRTLSGFRGGSVMDVAFSPSGNLVAGLTMASIADYAEFNVWNVQTGKKIVNLVGEEDQGIQQIDTPIAIWPTDKAVITGTLFVNIRGSKPILKPLIKLKDYTPIMIDTLARFVVLTRNMDSKDIEIWNLQSKRRVRVFSGKGGAFIVFAPQSRLCAIARDDKTIQIYALS